MRFESLGLGVEYIYIYMVCAGRSGATVQSTFKEGRDDTCVKIGSDFLYFVVVLVTSIVFALNVVMMTPMVKNLSRKP